MENIDIDKDNLKNIDIDIDMAILENIDIDIDIDKGILQNIDIDKISYRLGFGISNTPTWPTLICLGLLWLFQITIERLKCLKAISGRDWNWDGMEISVGSDSKSTAFRC